MVSCFLRAIQELLGNRGVSTTTMYGHVRNRNDHCVSSPIGSPQAVSQGLPIPTCSHHG